MSSKWTLVLLCNLILPATAHAKSLECTTRSSVKSPNQKIEVALCLDGGFAQYGVSYDSQPIISWSRLGFLLQDMAPLKDNLQLKHVSTSSYKDRWEQVWGEEHFIDNVYNELRVELRESTDLARTMTIVFRVYDDGIGFRYEIPEQKNISDFVIIDELTEFNFSADHRAWWIPAFQPNRDEQLFRRTVLSQMPTVHTPLTNEDDNLKLFYSIHEAAVMDYSSMNVVNTGGGNLRCGLYPWADGSKVRTRTPLTTPWRTLQIGRTPGDLITSYLILNLNEPSKIADTSWIKPQKFMGIWWGMHLERYTWSSGPNHGATTANTKRYIDYAVSLGIPAVLVEGWNIGWDGDWVRNDQFNFTQAYPDFDINYLVNYARERGVNLIGHHETGAHPATYERQLEGAFAYYQRLGINTVKTGYVGDKIDNGEWHYGQYMVLHYQRVVDEAIQHKIMLDVHEPMKDTGLRRTYPNMMAREGARGQEWNAWDDNGGNPPSHTTIIPFTRSLAGPFDFTPGIFDVFASAKPGKTRVWSTIANQLALYVVIYSPLQMAADLPENYLNQPMFQFIRDVPTDWETTKVLNGSIGEFITIVRKERDKQDWYLGSITNEKGREFSIDLSFLDVDKDYCAEIYRDGGEADYLRAPLKYEIEKRPVRRSTVLSVRLAPGGGQAVRFVANSVCI